MPVEAADAAFALMSLSDYASNISRPPERKFMPKATKARLSYLRGLLSYKEVCSVIFGEAADLLSLIIEALCPHPVSPDAIEIETCSSEYGLGVYPVQSPPAKLWHGVPVYDAPWFYGFVEKMGCARYPRSARRAKNSSIILITPRIEQATCQIAFATEADYQVPAAANAFARLEKVVGACPTERLKHVRTVLADLILWHEIAHIWFHRWIRRFAARFASETVGQVLCHAVNEFYAERRVVRQVLQAGDDLQRDIYLLLILQSVRPHEKPTSELPPYKWPIARALAREDGLRYLSSIELELRGMLNGPSLNSIDRWFERRADEAAADLQV